MGGKLSITRTVSAMILACGLALSSAPVTYAASKVVAVVNGAPITSGDIAKRAAFMRLQRQSGGPGAAREQMIDEALKREEVLRVGASVSTTEVEGAVGRFAAGNKLSIQQLSQVLDQAGVGIDHFRNYVAVAMSWPRVVSARFGGGGGGGRLSNEDLVRRMQENGGNKPVTTEYFLQQVIFVVPASKRNAIIGKRQAEANASRSKYPGCEQAKVFAATMRDVSIRNLGRMMAQELPGDWKPLIEKAGDSTTTATRVTERGVEYLAICKKREVSDDLAAEIVFRAEDLGKKQDGDDPNSKRYIEELRKRAQIIEK